MTKVNLGRLKTLMDVTDNDLQQPIHNQPIVVGLTKYISPTVDTVAVFAAAGAAVGALGFLGGPVGLVTTPTGIAVGISLGIIATVTFQ